MSPTLTNVNERATEQEDVSFPLSWWNLQGEDLGLSRSDDTFRCHYSLIRTLSLPIDSPSR